MELPLKERVQVVAVNHPSPSAAHGWYLSGADEPIYHRDADVQVTRNTIQRQKVTGHDASP